MCTYNLFQALQALEKYGHNIVIGMLFCYLFSFIAFCFPSNLNFSHPISGNLLKTRKKEVWIVRKEGEEEKIMMDEAELDTDKEIEEKIVHKITSYHRHFQEAALHNK